MSWIIASLILALSPAQAQEGPDTESTVTTDEGTKLGANVRYRYMIAPRGIVNSFYADTKDWTGEYASLRRPGISVHVIGLEFAVEPMPANFQFYAEYWKVNMDEGYWDDRDDGVQEQEDGDWMAPSGLGMVALGANFGHEFEVTDSAKDVWVGFRLGGGLGLGIPTGSIDQWHPGASFSTEPTNNCEPDLHAIDRHDVCPADTTLNLPPVLPVLDLDLAWRFHFNDTGILRIDAGIHDLLFFGVAGGAVF